MNNTCLKCDGPAKNKFCSRSCANSYNNSIVPRRKPEHKCLKCDGPTTASKRFCSMLCREQYYALHTTLGDLRAKAVRHAQVYNTLRQKSRRYAMSMPGYAVKCWECGWDEHVEIAHKKDLSSLPDETIVIDAVGFENFFVFCPNHHWKYDHDTTFREKWLAYESPFKWDYGD